MLRFSRSGASASREKSRLRLKFLRLRAAISTRKAAGESAAVCRRLSRMPEFLAAASILFYYPVNSELDCLPAVRTAFKLGKNVFFPRVRRGRIECVKVGSMHAVSLMKPGSFGIPRPSGRAVQPERMGLVVLPAVALDRRGARLGFGGGFYDRFLGGARAFRVGVCFQVQLCDRLPAGRHDAVMDAVASGKSFFYCSRAKVAYQARNVLKRHADS